MQTHEVRLHASKVARGVNVSIPTPEVRFPGRRAPRNTYKAIREVEAVVETMPVEHDPLASTFFVFRRHYQNLSDTKSGKRRAMSAQLSWQTACELGFRGNLHEWERLMGAATKR